MERKPYVVCGPGGSGTTLIFKLLQENIAIPSMDVPVGGAIDPKTSYHLSWPHQIPFEWHRMDAFRGHKKIFVLRESVHTIYSFWSRFLSREMKGSVDHAVNVYNCARRVAWGALLTEGSLDNDNVYVLQYGEVMRDPDTQLGRLSHWLDINDIQLFDRKLVSRDDDRWKNDELFYPDIARHLIKDSEGNDKFNGDDSTFVSGWGL